MSKNGYQKPSLQAQGEVLEIAKSFQRPAQIKEHIELIAQGIQQGIDLYTRQQPETARELNKQRKKLANQKAQFSEQSRETMKHRKSLYIDSTGCLGHGNRGGYRNPGFCSPR